MNTIQLKAADGAALSANQFGTGELRVVIAGATGVRQRFYSRFASALASQGLPTLTFDYRGIGASQQPRTASFSMRSWAELDLATAIDHAARSGQSLAVVGHSFGGQALGLAPNNEQVAALLGVSAQSGHWRLWGWRHKPWMWTMMHLVLPGLLRFKRDIPAGLLGPDPLPGGVAREWARWCRGPHYVCDAQGHPIRTGYASWQGTARFYQITDDPRYAPPRAVQELAGFYSAAQCEVVERDPSQWDLKTLGHFDFFKPSNHAGWAEAAQWLKSQLACSTGAASDFSATTRP